MSLSRLRNSAAFWLLPSLFCLYIYWPSLKTWFTGDDFVWLGLLPDIHNSRDLWSMVFQPTPHGTWRPLSERAFFIALEWIFGFDPLPFHICMFVTQFANLALLSSIVWKMTGSRIAAFCAPVFWLANSNLDTAMSWPSAYMQILCGFCILLAFRFLLLYIETGKRRYNVLQWAVFLIGFGVMETMVVYPAIAAVYTFSQARKRFVGTLPMFIPAAAFAVAHMLLAPRAQIGAYAMHFDLSLARTFWTYWTWTFAPVNLTIFTRTPAWAVTPILALFTLGLAAFIIRSSLKKDWLPLIFFSWFVILILPVAPLRDHVSDYYLTLPIIGLAALGAYGLACAWREGTPFRAAAALLAAIYLVTAIPVARGGSKWWYRLGRDVETVVMGVAAAHELHPGKAILLTGINNVLFWEAVFDHPFQALGIQDVYVDPKSEAEIQGHEGAASISDFVMPANVVLTGLAKDQIVVYEPEGDRFRNVTHTYAQTTALSLKAETPRRVDVGNKIQNYLFGPEWYAREEMFRWMPKRATVSIGGPRASAEKLYITGHCAPQQLKAGPLRVTVTAEGTRLGESEIRNCDGEFQFDYSLPANLVGKDLVQLALEVNRTFVPPGDGRELGLIFGTFEIK